MGWRFASQSWVIGAKSIAKSIGREAKGEET